MTTHCPNCGHDLRPPPKPRKPRRHKWLRDWGITQLAERGMTVADITEHVATKRRNVTNALARHRAEPLRPADPDRAMDCLEARWARARQLAADLAADTAPADWAELDSLRAAS
ncbi:MAG: hypothetical protein OXF27_20000 [Acidobacteria bacterium]|nr:hypothetical protein [Acidobacteriota bacterium]